MSKIKTIKPSTIRRALRLHQEWLDSKGKYKRKGRQLHPTTEAIRKTSFNISDFGCANFSYADFSNLDFSNLDFYLADFHKANFRHAFFDYANFLTQISPTLPSFSLTFQMLFSLEQTSKELILNVLLFVQQNSIKQYLKRLFLMTLRFIALIWIIQIFKEQYSKMSVGKIPTLGIC